MLKEREVCICVFCISVFFTVLFQHYIHSRATFQYLLQQIATHLFYIWIWIQFNYLLAFGFDSITLTGIWIQFNYLLAFSFDSITLPGIWIEFNYLLAFSFDSITLTGIWIELAFFLLSMCISFILFVLSYFERCAQECSRHAAISTVHSIMILKSHD